MKTFVTASKANRSLTLSFAEPYELGNDQDGGRTALLLLCVSEDTVDGRGGGIGRILSYGWSPGRARASCPIKGRMATWSVSSSRGQQWIRLECSEKPRGGGKGFPSGLSCRLGFDL